MRRFTPLAVVLALLVTAVLAGGCSPSAKEQARDAIKLVALNMDGGKITRETTSMDAYGAATALQGKQFDLFLQSLVGTATSEWLFYTGQRKLGGAWPGDATVISAAADGSQAKQNILAAGTTKCPHAAGAGQVTPTTKDAFYCVKDTMMVRDIVRYQQGTLWIPSTSMYNLLHGAIGTPDIAREALFVYLAAHWGDAYTRQLVAYAKSELHASLPQVLDVPTSLDIGYCFAGALAKATFKDGQGAQALTTLYGSLVSKDRALLRQSESLAIGYAKGKPGDCVRKLWPTSSSSRTVY